MRREAGSTILVGIEHLEHDCLVRLHAGKVIPAVGGVVFQPVGLAHPVPVAALDRDEVVTCSLSKKSRTALERFTSTKPLPSSESSPQIGRASAIRTSLCSYVPVVR